MPTTIEIKQGDTLSGILLNKGIAHHLQHQWIGKIKKINPHISDLNRIYIGDRLLIPDILSENLTYSQIWESALSAIPVQLRNANHNSIQLYFIKLGDTVDTISRYMFENSLHRGLSASSKRALLIHNNLVLENHLTTVQLPQHLILDITPALKDDFDKQNWQREQTQMRFCMEHMDETTRNLYTHAGPEASVLLAQAVEKLKSVGASVGLEDTLELAGFGTAGVSGYATSGEMSIKTVNALTREIYDDMLKTFGPKIMQSKKANHLEKIQAYFKKHPRYPRLIESLKELPKKILPKTNFTTPNLQTNFAAARHFRRHVTMPIKNWSNASKYSSSFIKQLNGKITYFKGLGRHASWTVPAAFGLINVADAPKHMQMRMFFEEGFGVLGGVLGTGVGQWAGGLIAVAIFGFGPFGIFVTILVCAAVGGAIGSGLFKGFGGKTYDITNTLGNRFYNSIDELIGVLQ
jgi:hypothetical protein